MADMRQLAGKALRRLKRLGLKPGEAPAILMCHRIADPPHDPWSLCVIPENFARQLEYIAANHTPISVDDLVAALDAGDAPPHAIAVTFDDGYTDNLRVAKPLLDQFGIPATFF
jgi:peptidoglycan/xylan/chitin deacetylase (PgdA/CDA1 family)